jgi:hypothetical protein
MIHDQNAAWCHACIGRIQIDYNLALHNYNTFQLDERTTISLHLEVNNNKGKLYLVFELSSIL